MRLDLNHSLKKNTEKVKGMKGVGQVLYFQ